MRKGYFKRRDEEFKEPHCPYPFCNFGVGEQCVVRAGDSGSQTTCYAVIRGIETFGIAGWVVSVLPVTVLGLVESIPDRDVLIVTTNYESCVVEEVIDDSRVRPSTIRIEKS